MSKSVIFRYFSKDPVLFISGALAILSCFFVKPSATYAEYIDLRTLVLLFSLMAVVSGFSNMGAFQRVAGALTSKAGSARKAVLMLVLMCFVFSMFVTNDVALMTLVPLAVIIMHRMAPEHMAYTIILQTVAANLGSMMTPFGNPQNLFLYTHYEMELFEFLKIVLPAGIFGLAAVSLLCLRVPGKGSMKEPSANERLEVSSENVSLQDRQSASQLTVEQIVSFKINRSRLVAYMALFLICVATVLRFVPYGITGIVVAVVMLILDRKAVQKVDYSLLITFVFFFVFAGNVGSMEAVNQALSAVLQDSTVLAAAIVSQFISNVPAAVLLSGFTEDGAGLLLGTDIGGLGTLVASMASLISFRIYIKTAEAQAGKYIVAFSAINFALLAIMLCGVIVSNGMF